MTEEAIHRSIVAYLRAVLPHGWIVQHTANRPRSKIAGGIEKALGAIKGWPDIAIFGTVEREAVFVNAIYDQPTSWFLEVKAARGRVLPEQRAVHDRLKDLGFEVAVVRSIDETRDIIRRWGLPSREGGQS
jgi:hypothetical protein